MKNLIILVGFLFAINANAALAVKMQIKDYTPTELEMVNEIKTDAYEKITLDCLGFIKGMRFYYNNEQERLVYMEERVCEDVDRFLSESKKDKLPVCMELDAEENSITFSREVESCQ